jgi:sRNA-binding carbon storage regulator CsrA
MSKQSVFRKQLYERVCKDKSSKPVFRKQLYERVFKEEFYE